MRKLSLAFIFGYLVYFALAAPAPARAAESPPTEASIQELMAVMETRKLTDHTIQQFEAAMAAATRQALAGQGLSQKQEQILGEMHSRIIALVREAMGPETLEPVYLDIYKSSFTQREVDGLLAFYKTEAGQALLNKMPAVMLQAAQAMQQRMAQLMPKIRELQLETFERLKATEEK
ncbi:MAG TPA: DUF2059 domain-containing protein [Candidatus Binatia bacterium]